MMVIGAEDRNRTGTVITNRGILSPVRLPVPPPRHYSLLYSRREHLICYHIALFLSRTFLSFFQTFFDGAGDGNRTHVTSLEG